MAFTYELLQPLGRPAPGHRRPAALPEFYFGACYYPEHWTEAERAGDPQMMAEAGINVVRMMEFAWDIIEPREGVFDFSLFDAAIAALGAKGIKTILCTPTATPPRWLSRRYPEIVRVDADGRRMQHGSRQHACHSNDTFREYSRRITRAAAEHFRNNPHVVGWQTDNEILCHFQYCYCEACQRTFPEYLRARWHNDIGRLNADWGTSFWAQTYDDFAAIPLPRESAPAFENPGHRLAYKMYIADAAARFQHEQIEILRSANPQWFVTHNGIMPGVDYRGDFSRDLDCLGYDAYPYYYYNPEERAAGHAHSLDRARGFSGNFFVPEHQSGPGGQRPYFHDNPEPGEIRRMTFSSIARGADSLMYFRWRSCRFGAEEYWCGILDHDNKPRRRYAEIARIGKEVAAVAPELRGTSVRVDMGLAGGDFAVDEAHETYTLGLPSHRVIAEQLHRWGYYNGMAVGYVHPEDTLAGLKLYIIPHWAYFDERWTAPLTEFVRGGGVLLIGARTATRDTRNQVTAQTLPGCLAPLCGVTVEEYGRLNAPEVRPYRWQWAEGEAAGGEGILARDWYEILEPAAELSEGAVAITARWTTRHAAGQAAVSRRTLGKGAVWYVGTYLTEETIASLLPRVAADAGLAPVHPCWQPGAEITCRENDEKKIWFITNTGDKPLTIREPPQGTDLLNGQKTGAVLELAANEVAVIRADGSGK